MGMSELDLWRQEAYDRGIELERTRADLADLRELVRHMVALLPGRGMSGQEYHHAVDSVTALATDARKLWHPQHVKGGKK